MKGFRGKRKSRLRQKTGGKLVIYLDPLSDIPLSKIDSDRRLIKGEDYSTLKFLASMRRACTETNRCLRQGALSTREEPGGGGGGYGVKKGSIGGEAAAAAGASSC